MPLGKAEYGFLSALYTMIAEENCDSQSDFEEKVLRKCSHVVASETSTYAPSFKREFEESISFLEQDIAKSFDLDLDVKQYFVVLDEPFADFTHTSTPGSSYHLHVIPRNHAHLGGTPASLAYRKLVALHEDVHVAQFGLDLRPSNWVLMNLTADIFAASVMSELPLGVAEKFCDAELPRHPALDIPVYGFDSSYGALTEASLGKLEPRYFPSVFINALDLSMGEELKPSGLRLYFDGLRKFRGYCERNYSGEDSFLKFTVDNEEEIISELLF